MHHFNFGEHWYVGEAISVVIVGFEVVMNDSDTNTQCLLLLFLFLRLPPSSTISQCLTDLARGMQGTMGSQTVRQLPNN